MADTTTAVSGKGEKRKIVFLITGKNKTDVVYDIMKSGDTGPAAYVAQHAESVDIFTDVEIAG